MAHAKLAALAVLVVILLHASTRAVAIDQMPATMTLNGFGRGEGEPAECDGQYHNDNEMLAALSTTRWYAGGIRCQRMISIRSTQNGRTVRARVVDECGRRHGCKDNIVDTSVAVWNALGLDTIIGEVPITWSDS
ncbi:hypothetical protein ACQ4PT_049674 [Festuca glaucescens]